MQLRDFEQITELYDLLGEVCTDLYRLEQKSMIKSQQITDMPRGGAQDLNTVEKYVNEKMELEKKAATITAEIDKLTVEAEEYLKQCQDEEIKRIIELRTFQGYSWENIGQELGYHRTTVSRKYEQFFEDQAVKELKQRYAHFGAR